MGKGEIARYEQFLLFPQCFQKAYFPGASKGVIVWEWLKLNEYQKLMLVLSCEMVEIIVEKGENSGDRFFSFSFNVFKSLGNCLAKC